MEKEEEQEINRAAKMKEFVFDLHKSLFQPGKYFVAEERTNEKIGSFVRFDHPVTERPLGRPMLQPDFFIGHRAG